MRNTSPRLILSALCLAMSATAAMADPLVMGPTPVAIGTYTAFDVSNTATYVDQNNTAGLFPPFLLTENIIAAGTSSQTTQLTFANGSAALAVGSTAAGFSTSPTVTSISGQISNHRGITVSTANDPPDTITAYAGSSMFFNFTITQTAAVTMNWSIAFTGAAPTQTVMFWDISGSNPFLGSVASSTNVDAGSWSGTFAPGEYSMIFTRHDGNASQASLTGDTVSSYTFTATIPAPGCAALITLAGLTASRRRRPTPL